MTIHTGYLTGLLSTPVAITAELSPGLPELRLPEIHAPAQKETRTRVRAALEQSGFPFPPRMCLTVRCDGNVPQGGYRPKGTFDLPCALAILVAQGVVSAEAVEEWFVVGSLSFTGAVQYVTGVLPLVRAAQAQGVRKIMVPLGNAPEASLAGGDLQVFGVATLQEALGCILGILELQPTLPSVEGIRMGTPSAYSALSSRTQRALLVAAAGRHAVRAEGHGSLPLARALRELLPPMTKPEALEVMSLHSVAGLLWEGLKEKPCRPFRAPHDTTTNLGQHGEYPGEATLAHEGILFLQDLQEFSRAALDTLENTMRLANVTSPRTKTVYPTDFLLVASVQRCPCSALERHCTCTPERKARWEARIPKFLQEHLEIVISPEILGAATNFPMEDLHPRIRAVWERQKVRGRQTGVEILRSVVPAGCVYLEHMTRTLALPQGVYGKVLQVARTVADLTDSPAIEVDYLHEARCLVYPLAR